MMAVRKRRFPLSRPPPRGSRLVNARSIRHRELRMTNLFQGTLDEDELTGTLRSLQAAEASGVLHVARDGCEKRILSAGSHHLGVPRCGGRRARARARRPGTAGVHGDETTRAELERSALYSILSWRKGEYRFEEGEPWSTPTRLDLTPSEAVEESLRQTPQPPGETASDGESPSRVRWSANATPLAEVTLSTKESTLLDFLRSPTDQNLTASELRSLPVERRGDHPDSFEAPRGRRDRG